MYPGSNFTSNEIPYCFTLTAYLTECLPAVMVQPTGGDYRMTPVDTPRHVRGVHGRVAPPSTPPTD